MRFFAILLHAAVECSIPSFGQQYVAEDGLPNHVVLGFTEGTPWIDCECEPIKTELLSEQLKDSFNVIEEWLSTSESSSRYFFPDSAMQSVLSKLHGKEWKLLDYDFQFVPFKHVGDDREYLWVNALPRSADIDIDQGVVVPIGGGRSAFRMIIFIDQLSIVTVEVNGM